MTDYSRDRPDDEDRLPWLEPVEEDYEEGGVSTGRLILWLTAALVVIALMIGGFLWMRSSEKAASGDGALIKAPDSYYKERPPSRPRRPARTRSSTAPARAMRWKASSTPAAPPRRR